MENKGKDDEKLKSSLLFQPGSLATWNNVQVTSPLFMPVAADSSSTSEVGQEVNASQLSHVSQEISMESKPLFSSPFSVEHSSPGIASFSQLQQPLMVRKSPSPQPGSSTSTQYSSTVPKGLFQSGFPTAFQAAPESHVPPATLYPNYETVGMEMPKHFQQIPYSPNKSEIQIPHFNGVTSFESNISPYVNKYALSSSVFHPVQPHWFFKETVENKDVWRGFSQLDSEALEWGNQNALSCGSYDSVIISTDGGRFDVYLKQREKRSVYWEEEIHEVRRCTWFYRSEGANRYLPYEEHVASSIEDMYCKCIATGTWHQKLLLGNEAVVIEGPHTVLHYAHGIDTWAAADAKSSPKAVFRGVPPESEMAHNETKDIDHLVFVVQGIGSVCDLRFRSVSQCVDDVREIAHKLTQVHFKGECEMGKVNRIEFLPLAWHSSLHTDDTGLDRRMKTITLPSIPKLRHFTNDTLLDILLYSSPMYCQTIIDTVTSSLNRVYRLFLSRNSGFKGSVSVAGHSLGSLILFDVLANQNIPEVTVAGSTESENANQIDVSCNLDLRNTVAISTQDNKTVTASSITIESLFEEFSLEEYLDGFLSEKMDMESLMLCDESELKALGLPMGPRKKLLAYIEKEQAEVSSTNVVSVSANSEVFEPVYLNERNSSLKQDVNTKSYVSSVFPVDKTETTLSSITFHRLEFDPVCFFALGSPIAMFLAVRGFSQISEDYSFSTCPSFFNIFHPFDPVAFRIEPLIDPKFAEMPVTVLHHKGRKRLHLEIRENIVKVGSELKQKLLDTIKYTWDHLNALYKPGSFPTEAVEAEVEKLVHQQISTHSKEVSEDVPSFSTLEGSTENKPIGRLNKGRRIDYVLQEKPIEALNEYIFAISSHATYWNSEDTILMVLKEIYYAAGIIPAQPSCDKGHERRLSNVSQQSCSDVPFSACEFQTRYPDRGHLSSSVTNFGYSSIAPESSSDMMYNMDSSNVVQSNISMPQTTLPSAPVTSSQPLLPPPLSGFVRQSPFSKQI